LFVVGAKKLLAPPTQHTSTDLRQPSLSRGMEIDYDSLPEVTMIQLPCYCENIKKVESFLGGKESLEQTILEENKQMRFSWDPSDSLRPLLKGKRNPKQGILISLKKLKSGAVVSKALGRVTHSYSFDSPPDYQVNLMFSSCWSL
jgi:hypothetical protein